MKEATSNDFLHCLGLKFLSNSGSNVLSAKLQVSFPN